MAVRYLTDDSGDRIGVMLEIAEYDALLEKIEDLEAALEYDRAKAAGEQPVPLERALEEIERERQLS